MPKLLLKNSKPVLATKPEEGFFFFYILMIFGEITKTILQKVWCLFENLLKNAVDAIEDREGVIRVVTRRWNESFVEALVSDNGKGIDPRVDRMAWVTIEHDVAAENNRQARLYRWNLGDYPKS